MRYKILSLILLSFFILTNLRAQIIGGNAFLKGNFVEVGVGPCGTYGSSIDAPSGYHPRGNGPYLNRLGFIADPNKDGWDAGTPNYCGDYFVPGVPEEGFGLQVNGVNYNNNQLCSEVSIPGSITDYKISGTNTIGTWSGTIGGLQITTVTTVPLNDVFFISEVTLKNTTGSTLNNVYYMRNVDPDNEVTLPGGEYTTNNFIVAQNPNVGSRALVSATGLRYGCYLGLGTLDCRARVAYGGFSNRNPAAVWNGTGGLSQSGSSTADIAIAIAFKINSLAPGESTTFRFAHVLSASDLERALNLTVPFLQVNGISVANGSSINICEGVPVSLQIINGSAYTFNWSPAAGLNMTTGSNVVATVNSATTYTATGVDACGGNVSLNVTLNPTLSSSLGTIGAISGPTSICLPTSNQTYSVAPVTNAALYEWTVPFGVSIVGGDGTNSVNLSFSSPVTGTVSVKARNGCGVTNTSSLSINASTANPPVVTFNDVAATAPPSSSGITVNYPAPEISSSIPISVVYTPISGSFFPIGTTTVSVTASNTCGSVTKSFKVIVTEATVPNVYYSKATGDLHNVLTWGVNPDGSGANPPDFGAGKTFNLANRVINYTMTADWTVGGLIVNPSGAQLQINGFTLSEAGISGAGTVTGSPASNLIVTGSTPHTLNFTLGNVNFRTLNNLTLNRAASGDVVALGFGEPLNILNVLSVNIGTLTTNNSLTLKSTATNTARVAPMTATGIVSGNVTVERYIPARRAWRLLAAPVGGTQNINAAWQEGATTFSGSPNPNPGFGTHITQSVSGGTDGLDFNTATAMASLKKHNNPTNTWVPVLNTNSPAVNSNAWFIFVRGDRSINMGYNTVAPNNTVLRANGPLRIGDQTFPVAASGLTAIPNPYASPLNFATIAANNPNIINSFTVVDPKLGSTGAFVNVSFNGVSYDVTPAAVSPITELIQSGQGFLVQSIGVAGNLVIREVDKSATLAANVFRVAENTSTGFVANNTSTGLRINLQTTISAAAQLLDEVFSSYNNNFSNNVDNMDVLKATNPEENLGIVTQEQTIMVDRRKYVSAGDIIQLKLWNTLERNYILEINPVNLTSLKVTAFLEDSYLKTSTLIDLNKGAKISFIVTSDVVSKNPYRFRIVFSNAKATLESIFTSGKAEIQAVPNPTVNKSLGVQLINQPQGLYNVELTDNLGRVIYRTNVAHAGGTVRHTVLLEGKVAKGLYNLKVIQGGTVKTMKVLIY